MKKQTFLVLIVSSLMLNLFGVSFAQTQTSRPNLKTNAIKTEELKLDELSQKVTSLSDSNNSLKFWLIFLGVLGCFEGLALLVVGYLYFDKQRQVIRKLRLDISSTIDHSTQSVLAQLSNQNTTQKAFYEKNKERLLQMTDKLSNLENLIYSLEVRQSKTDKNEVNKAHSSIVTSSEIQPLKPEETLFLINEIESILTHFNNNNKDYFRDSRFQPLTLTQSAIHGNESRMDGCPIIQFESTELSNAEYLKVEANGEKFLLPNITSPRFHKIINGLHEYSGIFFVPLGDNFSLKLIKLAKLKEISSKLWEIEEPGEFQG